MYCWCPRAEKRRAAVILLLILCFVLVIFPEIAIVKADVVIYIRADERVEGTDKIQREGTVYTFTDDISGSIVFDFPVNVLPLKR